MRKLYKNSYYWVHTIFIYRGSKEPHKSENKVPFIAYHEKDGSWSIIGSDECFETYVSDEKCQHAHGYIKPVKRIPDFEEAE